MSMVSWDDAMEFANSVAHASGWPEEEEETKTPGPRVPVDEKEAYAWGFMVGYTGDENIFVTDEIEWYKDAVPEALVPEVARGYEAGVAFYTDHLYPEDREA